MGGGGRVRWRRQGEVEEACRGRVREEGRVGGVEMKDDNYLFVCITVFTLFVGV